MSHIKKLLIVDDCTDDRRIYCRYLMQDPYQSYEIVEANSAEDGLILCQQQKYDVILIDLCLPDLNGLDFLDRLKQKQYHLPSSAIMLTGYGNEKTAVQAMKRGVHDYLVKKHLKPDVLQLTVRNALEKYDLQNKINKIKERQRLIGSIALRIRQSLNLEDILQTAVFEIQQLFNCDRVVIYQFASEIPEFSKFSYCREDLNLSITPQQFQNWQERNAIANVYQTGGDSCCLQKTEELKSQANLVIPIHLGDREACLLSQSPQDLTSQVWGLLVVHQCIEERRWQTEDLEILQEVAIQLAIAIQQAELLAQTQAALAKEKQLNLFKSQIIATVSHEYRTPLAGILAAASTIQQHKERLEPDKQQRFLKIIEDKARHLGRIVSDMLLIEQIELDKTKFRPVAVDLPKLFADLLEEQQDIVDDRHELILKISGDCENFAGDRGLLRQIFFNLISNAIKYSPHGGKIELSITGKSSQIIFQIVDRGIGIPSEEQHNLFQSFFRASNTDTIPGTGLGLAITKACVELHSGNIEVESKLGCGTKISVILPKQHQS
jgi:signal transduction histidine kinase